MSLFSLFRPGLILLSALLLAAGARAAAPLQGYAIVAYSTPDAVTTAWMDQRFAYRLAGPRPGMAGVKWMGYQDIYGLGTLPEYLDMKDWARAAGLDHEAMLLHARSDYTSRVGRLWDGLDRFDAFEGRNGVLRSPDGIGLVDVTASAYDGQVSLGGFTFIGYEEPFAEINLTFAQTGLGVTAALQYWSGAGWQPLAVQDGTAGLTQAGRISFTPPPDWAPLSLNGSRHKHFVRLVVSAAQRLPVSQRIRGDHWLGAASNAGRGWDPASATIVNRGTPLAYNPTPPAGASAKFPYQARIGFWAANHFVANPADRQGLADGSWASWLANRIVRDARAIGTSGVMCDDGERDVADDGVPAGTTDFIDQAAGATWAQSSLQKYQNLVRLVRQQLGGYALGVNAAGTDLSRAGQWNIIEYHTFVWKTNDLRGITRGDDGRPIRMAYDDYLPAANPNGTVGVFLYDDSHASVSPDAIAWERGNRGPIAALSKHHIARNANTVFAYYSRGGYIYDETDEVVLTNGRVLHQARSPLPVVSAVRRWATFFPAMAVDIGTPDPAGYLAGARDLAWKRGADLGGGPDVWRRDYTGAIVLHRPAAWNTTAAGYSTYSSPISLGGFYYPLAADGTVGRQTNTIRLRAGEGAILLKRRPAVR